MPRTLPRPMITDVEQILKRVRNQKTIGDVCYWQIDEIEIQPEDLKKLLKARGLEDWSPVPIRVKTAARKAITEMRKTFESGSIDAGGRNVLVRRVRETEEEVRYALIYETADLANVDLSYSTFNQVVFDKIAGDLKFTKEEVESIRDRFRELCEVYTKREVQIMVLNIIKGHGAIGMGDGTGMYFIPVAHRHVVDAIDGLLNTDLKRFGGRSAFRAFGIINSEKERAQMGGVVRADILVELKDAESYMDEVLTNFAANPEGRFAQTQLKAALDKYKSAHGKATMYKQLLHINLDDLEKQMVKNTDKIQRALGAFDDEDEE